MIRDTCARSRRSGLRRMRARWDREHHFPREELRELGELGVLGMVVPPAVGRRRRPTTCR